MWKESRMKRTAYHLKLTERRCVAGEVIVWMPGCESVRDWWNLSGASFQFCFLIWDHCRRSHKWLSNGTRYIHKIWLHLFAKAVLTLHNNRSCQWNNRKRSLNKYPISNISFQVTINDHYQRFLGWVNLGSNHIWNLLQNRNSRHFRIYVTNYVNVVNSWGQKLSSDKFPLTSFIRTMKVLFTWLCIVQIRQSSMNHSCSNRKVGKLISFNIAQRTSLDRSVESEVSTCVFTMCFFLLERSTRERNGRAVSLGTDSERTGGRTWGGMFCLFWQHFEFMRLLEVAAFVQHTL